MKVPLVRKKLISDSCVSMNSELATLALHWWGDEQKKRPSWVTALITGQAVLGQS